MDWHSRSSCDSLFCGLGYKVKKTPASGDYGADLIIEKEGRSIVVQAKRYAGKVGFDAIKEVSFAQAFYKTDEAWVITTSSFTPQANVAAEGVGVKLVDGSSLEELILEWRQPHVIEERRRKQEAELEAWRLLAEAKEKKRRELLARQEHAKEIAQSCWNVRSRIRPELGHRQTMIDTYADLGGGLRSLLKDRDDMSYFFGPRSPHERLKEYEIRARGCTVAESRALDALVSCIVFCPKEVTIYFKAEGLGVKYYSEPEPSSMPTRAMKYLCPLAPEIAGSWEKIEPRLLGLRTLASQISEDMETLDGFLQNPDKRLADDRRWNSVLELETLPSSLWEKWRSFHRKYRDVLTDIISMRPTLDELRAASRNAEEEHASVVRGDDGVEDVMDTTWVMQDGLWSCLNSDGERLTGCWVHLSSRNVWCRLDGDGTMSNVRYEGEHYYINLPLFWADYVRVATEPDDVVSDEVYPLPPDLTLKYASFTRRKQPYEFSRRDSSRVSLYLGDEECYSFDVFITDDSMLRRRACRADYNYEYDWCFERLAVPGVPSYYLNAGFDSKEANLTHRWVVLKDGVS